MYSLKQDLVVEFCPACGGVAGWYLACMGYSPCGTDRKGWCGKCYENTRARANHSGHHGYRQPRKERSCSMPLKAPKTSGASTSGMPASSWQGSPLASLPELMEFLSSTVLEEGAKRLTGTLQISTGQGRWQGKLRDLQAKVYCFVTSETLEGLLLSLNEVCSTGEADWRADEWPGGKGARK